MAPSQLLPLTLGDIDKLIQELEMKHQTSTLEFLKNPDVRNRVPEDDTFLWEVYIDLRRDLRQLNEQLHQKYLEVVSRPLDDSKRIPTTADLVDLAA